MFHSTINIWLSDMENGKRNGDSDSMPNSGPKLISVLKFWSNSPLMICMCCFRTDITSGELNVNSVADGNFSSGVVFALSEEPSSEKYIVDDFSEEEEELLTDDEPEEIPVVAEIAANHPSLPSTINSTANDSAATEEDIPLFSEWTQKALAEEEKSGNVSLCHFFFYYFTGWLTINNSL